MGAIVEGVGLSVPYYFAPIVNLVSASLSLLFRTRIFRWRTAGGGGIIKRVFYTQKTRRETRTFSLQNKGIHAKHAVLEDRKVYMCR